MKFKCVVCELEHDLSDISFGADAPAQWSLLSHEERAKSELSSDQCVIETTEGRHFFIRGCLEIPIKKSAQAFSWGVWCSLSEKRFLEASKHWEDPERVKLGPYFGWLSTVIPEYPDTMFLKTMVHQRSVGLRPLVILEESEHLLSLHQHHGLEAEAMQHIVSRVLHS